MASARSCLQAPTTDCVWNNNSASRCPAQERVSALEKNPPQVYDLASHTPQKQLEAHTTLSGPIANESIGNSQQLEEQLLLCPGCGKKRASHK